MVAESLAPGASVSKVAQRYSVNASLLFTRRRRETRKAASGGLEPSKLLPVTVADEGMAAAPIAPSAPAGRMEIALVGGERLLLARMWTQPPSRAWSRRCRGDDRDPGGRSGVAGDGPHRHAQGLRRAGAVRLGDAEARSALWPFVSLPRSQGRSDQMPWSDGQGLSSVRQTARTGTVPVAVDGRRNGDDLVGAAGLSAGGHRLANAGLSGISCV